ncbi:amidohydrolase family protein [Bacteroides sp.]
MKFYDSHAHCIKGQFGGILIGLEGERLFEGFMRNQDVEIASKNNPNFIPCYYITNKWNDVPDETLLKYHPRREQYIADEVIADLKKRNCKLCIIDTLNQPQWGYLDYWKVVAAFSNVKFILPHMGGYDIIDFVKMLDFNKNVYCDFAMTQEYFGWCGNRARFSVVADCIDYCLTHHKLSKKVMFGSDEPDFSQSCALEAYQSLPNANDLLVNNYLNLINTL